MKKLNLHGPTMTKEALDHLNVFHKYAKFLILGALLVASVFLIVNDRGPKFGIPAWYITLPVSLLFLIENIVKLWSIQTFKSKIAFYVIDVLSLLVLTIFSSGVLITVMYLIILTEYYLSQDRLGGSVFMCVACIVVLFVTFAFSEFLESQESNTNFDFISVASSMVSDFMLIVIHFLVINFAIFFYKKNRELTKANEELNEINIKLNSAYKELQEMTALEERQRIAKEIHDTAGHSITTVIMQTEAAKLVIDRDPADAKRKIAAANLQAKHALEELRESVHLLSGQDEGVTLKSQLLEIVHESTDGTGIAIRYEIDDIDLCDAKRRFLLNSLKEGISNGLRHGNATAFWFELKKEDGRADMLLSDNGKGMEISKLKEGFGLSGMHRRAKSLGGTVWFETEPGEGFEIHLSLPLDVEAAKE